MSLEIEIQRVGGFWWLWGISYKLYNKCCEGKIMPQEWGRWQEKQVVAVLTF